MKIYLKFDHSQKDSLKAIGCEYDGEQVNERVFDVIKWYSEFEQSESFVGDDSQNP